MYEFVSWYVSGMCVVFLEELGADGFPNVTWWI